MTVRTSGPGMALRAAGFLLCAALQAIGCHAAAQPAADPAAIAPHPGTLDSVRPTAPQAAAPVTVPAAPSPHALTADDANAWLDGFVPEALRDYGIAGAVVAIVKDGQVLTERGYGAADLATGAPVDPKATLFRPGSVSKLFTWTAVMQLVEAGKLDLDTDVNTYLDFAIPPRNGKPVTLRNLMTHTAGFEESVDGLIVSGNEGVSLERTLKRWIPDRVFDVGTTPAYSNYGAGLAGYIVQRVSGQPFEAYVEKMIFQPLGMASSSFAQPLPPGLLGRMSKGYDTVSAPPLPFEIISIPPAGSLSSTADDMARFMIAHLQDGRFGDVQILRPETAREMHTTRNAAIPSLNGMMLGFYEQNINGHRVIAHGGDTELFHSDLSLFLDDGAGLFVSFNGASARHSTPREALFEAFADRYFPADRDTATIDAKTAADHARLLAGHYVVSRGGFTNFLALANVISQTGASVNDDGTVSTPLGTKVTGESKRYRETSPFVWTQVDGHDRLGAIATDGSVVRFSSDAVSPFMVFDRAPVWMSAAWLVPALVCALVLLALAGFGWPAIALVRWRYGTPFPFTAARGWAYRLVRLTALAAVISAICWIALVSMLEQIGGLERVSALRGAILPLEALTLFATAGGLAAALFNVATVWRNRAGWWPRTWGVLLSLSFAVGLYSAALARLVNFSVDF